MNEATPGLLAPAAGGRSFTGLRRTRLGDVTVGGRLRLDALTRYTQDVSDDDTTDAGLSPEPAWVVRSTRVDVMASAHLGEDLTITTFCSGLGRRWAERHLSVVGSAGARYEVATLWICLDPGSGRPTELTDEFLAIYAAAAGDRSVGARLTHPKVPADDERWHWPLRAADFDVYGHVNNAAYWAVIEELLDAGPQPEPFHASIEYRAGLTRGGRAEMVGGGGGPESPRHLWWLGPAGELAASARISPGSPTMPAPGLWRVTPSPRPGRTPRSGRSAVP